jgi:CxxC motif-containing protein (DUF1111 family)
MGLQRTGARVRGRLMMARALALLVIGGALGCADARVPSVADTSDGTTTSTDPGSSSGAPDPTTSPTDSTTSTSGDPVDSTDTEPDTTAGDDTPPAPLEEGELRPGGETTVDELGIGAFVQRAANLSLLHAADFEAGLQFFQVDWEPAPGQSEIDGLGPTYNAISCLACHARNGRGLPSSERDPASPGVLLRLVSALGSPDPTYGDQLQPFAIPGVPAEGDVTWTWVPDRTVTLADGTEVMLFRVAYEASALPFGPLAPDTLLSPRLTPQLVGMGLLESIAEDDLLAAADPDDRDGDGIRGRAAWLPDGTLGRFGWKAAQPTVEHQTAAAFAGDLGITNALHPTPNCPPAQAACAAAPTGGTPELTDVRLHVTSAYVRLLGVPARRDGDDEDVRRGKTLFHALGCATCHRPSYVTATVTDPELSAQRIWPYTDLLLHDMGEGLADLRPEGAADGQQWRTPPLWGLGLVEVVNGTRYLLHDGRARSLAEAILWHGGESTSARNAYAALSTTDRDHLHLFIESL